MMMFQVCHVSFLNCARHCCCSCGHVFFLDNIFFFGMVLSGSALKCDINGFLFLGGICRQ